ncbi:MAG: hypothetical protein QXR30_00095 [Candidatus Woesearchaeota archaeon]
MDLKILQETNASLLKRKDYVVKITWENALPSRKEIRDKFIAIKNTRPELTVVKKFHTMFKKREALVNISVYEDEKAMHKLETKRFLELNGLIEVKK